MHAYYRSSEVPLYVMPHTLQQLYQEREHQRNTNYDSSTRDENVADEQHTDADTDSQDDFEF